jgi:hypothetical protein
MEIKNIDNQNTQQNEMWNEWGKAHKRGKIIGGIAIVIAGSLFLARELGAEIPHFLFTWKMLLIAVGVIGLIKHRFRRWGFIVPILIGAGFLAADMYPEMAIKNFIVPIAVILLGLVVIFKPRRNYANCGRGWHRHHRFNRRWAHAEDTISNEDAVNCSVYMGAVKKNIISKEFKGGFIYVKMGGAEINLSQADFTGTVTIDIDQYMSGVELIVPASWKVKPEIAITMGNIDDKRRIIQNTGSEPEKILILKGNLFMSTIELNSY